MKVKALTSFVGKISMALGEVREITDKAVVNDLLNAGYVVEEKPGKTEVATPPKKTSKKTK